MEYTVNVMNKKDGYLFNSTYGTLHDAEVAVDELKRANYFLPDDLKLHGNLIESSEHQAKLFNYLVIAEF